MNDIDETRAREEDLQSTMLAGDTSALSDRIDDRAVFTGPDGSVLDKAQDFTTHEFGMLKVSNIDAIDPMDGFQPHFSANFAGSSPFLTSTNLPQKGYFANIEPTPTPS